MDGEIKKTIFVVDDTSMYLVMAEAVLKKQYNVIPLSSAAEMFAALLKSMPDLILLDIEMPEMNGFETLKRLKASESYAEIPVIFLTGLSDPKNEALGIELGAVDFITKPFSLPVLLNRIKNHLHIDSIIRERTEQLRERSEQLMRLKDSIVYTLAELVENRDTNTGGHITRTALYMKLIIKAMLERGVYFEEINNWDIDSIVSSALMHDVGKIVISDIILNKPESLTQDELQKMQTHAMVGQQVIDRIAELTGETEFLHNAKLFAGYHHEHWDGTGYPYGLKGTDIPLQGRIMAIADVYDALTSQRSYKAAFSNEDAVTAIMDKAGKSFDPKITEVFYAIKDQFEAVRD
ncbi:MAG: response regulator [Treponema sp.]|nr:response regulator [Treponema sp.]